MASIVSTMVGTSLQALRTSARNLLFCRTLHISQRHSTNLDDTQKKTPLGRFSDSEKGKKDEESKQEVKEEEVKEADPFAPFPDATNPETGEVGGPTGPEPTRYGDWERKGRVTDF